MVLLVVTVVAGGCGWEEDGRARNFDGPWTRHTIDDDFRGADGVRVADVNGDGWPDVTSGWEQSGITRAYLHPGPLRARGPWSAVTVGSTPDVEDAVWADVDGDGRLDVVSSCEGGTRAVFVSFAPADPADFLDPTAWRTEPFPSTVGRRWMYALPMDVDGRGGIDLVVGGKGSDAVIGWLESPADADPTDLAAWTLHEISAAGWVMSMDAVDMNDDGLLDVLVSDRTSDNHGVRWLERPSEPEALREPWADHLIGARKRSPVFIAPVFDEGLVPRGVLVPSGGERLTYFQRESADGELWSELRLRYPHGLGTPKAVAVGDIDLDGVSDAVISTTNLSGRKEGLVWLAGGGDPDTDELVKFSLSGAQGEKFDRVELLDLDGDGDLDVLTTEELQRFGVIWYENPLRTPWDDED
ncbi:MAG: FG-GAP repeat domain-containing protein [Candidatus Binatia bacterium]